MTTLQTRTSLSQGFGSFASQRNGEDSNAVKAEAFAVDTLGPGGFIREELSMKGGLRELLSHNRHRAAVGFKKEKNTLMGADPVGKFQCKDAIGNRSQLYVPVQ